MQLSAWAKWLDCFKLCRCCGKAAGTAMIGFVLGLVGLTYYTVCFQTYFPDVQHGVLRAVGSITVVVVFSILVSLVCY